MMSSPKHSNVFVLCTGRCGSTTFARACSHFSNFTAAHESRSRMIGSSRFEYPKNHIEVDNRLSWMLGRLDSIYGQNAFYVHLTRDENAVRESYMRRKAFGIVKAYRSGILMKKKNPDEAAAKEELGSIVDDMIHTVTANIESFLKDKPHKMSFRLENHEADFAEFIDRVGAVGDIEKANGRFLTNYNASK